jgi:hypothetical protein
MIINLNARLFSSHAESLLKIVGYCDIDRDERELYELDDFADGVFDLLDWLHSRLDGMEEGERAAFWRLLRRQYSEGHIKNLASVLRGMADALEDGTP